MSDPAGILFDDVTELESVVNTSLHLSAKVNNDCDCVSYGPTSNRVQIDTEEITRIAHQEY